MAESDTLRVVIIGSAVILTLGAFFLTIIVSNQKKVLRYQKDRLLESQRSSELLALIPRKVLQAQEDERSRVARELHDGINQMLASIKYRFHMMNTLQTINPEMAGHLYETLSNDLVYAIDEVKRISHGLRPRVFDDLGFRAAVRSLMEEFEQRTGIAAAVSIETYPDGFPREVELALYRILQESLHNIEKHADATEVRIESDRTPAHWIVRIADNGVGMGAATAATRTGEQRGMGLETMRERIRLIGGEISFLPVPSGGSEVLLRIPVDRAE